MFMIFAKKIEFFNRGKKNIMKKLVFFIHCMHFYSKIKNRSYKLKSQKKLIGKFKMS